VNALGLAMESKKVPQYLGRLRARSGATPTIPLCSNGHKKRTAVGCRRLRTGRAANRTPETNPTTRTMDRVPRSARLVRGEKEGMEGATMFSAAHDLTTVVDVSWAQ
jgi:hypothetical protein